MKEQNPPASSFVGIWLIAFVLIKVAGTALASWSWWWLLFPIIPVLAVLLQKIGVL